MELIKKSFATRMKNLGTKVAEDNLFLLASSISYYSALAIAPFILILLGVASFIGVGVQERFVETASEFSPEVGQMVKMIFSNINEGVNIGSISGIIGLVVLFSTASLVFIQMRYAFDVIYGYYNASDSKGVGGFIKERLFAMFFVLMTGIFFIATAALPGLVSFVFGPESDAYHFYRGLAFAINLVVYVGMFWGIHMFVPSKRPKGTEALKMSILSSAFFIIGNLLLASYFKGVAASSVYGAAGSLLVFLTWTYYSSFTIFLSVEIFLYMKKWGKLGKRKTLFGGLH